MTVLGIDVGTTGTKTLALDERGEVLASSYREYELKNSGSTVSQNADDWWDAVCATVNDVASAVGPEKIDAISLSTQGASMLAASADGAALCEVMTWMDSRSAKEAECLDGAIGKRRVYEKCGWPLSPAGDAAKILWLKNNMPDVYDGASCFPSTIEFINKKYGKDLVEVTIKDSYLNMATIINEDPTCVIRAKEAIKKLGYNPVTTPIRGGTDGAKLTQMGLRTPNLGTGGYNYHGPYEMACLEEMELVTKILIEIAKEN